VKLNVEVSACVTALQWISEKLEWIRNMKEEEKETLKTELKKIGIKKIPRYVFYKEAYINLNIPLPQRVHDVMTYFSEFQTAFFISAALYSFVHYFLPLLPAPLLSISLIIEIVLTLSSFILIFCYLHLFILRKVKEESVVIKKVRMPEGITIWKEGKEIIKS
jgi:ABC-type multidrug transport system permease subunit